MSSSFQSHRSREEPIMIIDAESASALKRFISQTGLNQIAQEMVRRMVLAFILHRGRMSCSQAASIVGSETVHRGQVTRFLARLSEEFRRWWASQRLHGLCEAFCQECASQELKYYSERLKTSGGIEKMKRLLTAAIPPEFRASAS